MGFDFSAVTALLGGYSAPRRNPLDPDEGRHGRRRDHRTRGGTAGPPDAAGDGPTSGEGFAAVRLDGPPVTGGAPGAVSGIGRALDALMSAEETRRRKTNEAQGPATPLSAALKASLPDRKALPPPPAPEERPPLSARQSERNWDEIRDFIEALGRAERAPEPDSGLARPDSVRPWRPEKAS
ncbi:hypothetical protein [Jiella avicenniae]|uniref:Uncharacterized protein n=1 Tax=Jiella avicenniae TaxID=2907202 RepID=A0A9X1NZR5_9HYPH|nr:hypothetical protein [Jiella avicenniae]MCE7028830.1 hypothetical protein [Jiella avicenniae]